MMMVVAVVAAAVAVIVVVAVIVAAVAVIVAAVEIAVVADVKSIESFWARKSAPFLFSRAQVDKIEKFLSTICILFTIFAYSMR
jgi:hypothetical protein